MRIKRESLKKTNNKSSIKQSHNITDKITLIDNEKNKQLCGNCTYCCEYINIGIAPPKTEEDFDYILWFLLHEKVYVWIGKNNTWFVRVMNKCKPLKNGRCSNYSHRPMLCREYTQKKCEKENFTKDELYSFHTPEELVSYMKEKKKKFFGFYL